LRRITIVNLTAQFPDQVPDAQPSRPRAMADGIGRQFVNGKNHIRGPALRKARPAGLDEHLRAEHMKRARIKLLVKFGCHVTSIRGGRRRSLPWPDGRAACPPEVAHVHAIRLTRADYLRISATSTSVTQV
jgi:hypothetical protein